jgi:hypothetical protein
MKIHHGEQYVQNIEKKYGFSFHFLRCEGCEIKPRVPKNAAWIASKYLLMNLLIHVAPCNARMFSFQNLINIPCRSSLFSARLLLIAVESNYKKQSTQINSFNVEDRILFNNNNINNYITVYTRALLTVVLRHGQWYLFLVQKKSVHKLVSNWVINYVWVRSPQDLLEMSLFDCMFIITTISSTKQELCTPFLYLSLYILIYVA